MELATRLLGLEGLRVVEVDAEADGGVTVWVVTDDPLAANCPGCGAVAGVKGQVTAAPADVRLGGERFALVWIKRRRVCPRPCCPVGGFTESLPQVPPRCRLTVRLREHTGGLVADDGLTITGACRLTGVSWPTAHDAFAAVIVGGVARAENLIRAGERRDARRSRMPGFVALVQPGMATARRSSGHDARLCCCDWPTSL